MLEIFVSIFENFPVNLNVQVRQQMAMKAMNTAPIKEASFLSLKPPDVQGLIGILMMTNRLMVPSLSQVTFLS